MKKILVLTVIIAVVAVVVLSIVLGSKNGNEEGIEVETQSVERRQIVQTVTATGKIQPMTQVNISADVSAKITELAVNEGDWVEKGQFLLQLDRERYVAAVENAEATLRATQANANLARENMIKAEKDYDRIKQLFEKDLESQSQLDSMYAAAEVEKARHQAALDQTEQARAVLKQARDDLSKTTIDAPMAGTISRLNKEAGEMALGSQFQEDVILEISNLEGMEALVDIDENDIVLVAISDEAEIEVDALPDATFMGEVTEIANSAKVSASGTTDQKTEFEVKIAITEPGTTLRPGMTASGEIVTEVHEDALSVPIQCVAVRTLEQLGVKDSEVPEGNEDSDSSEEETESRFAPDSDGFVEFVWVVKDAKVEARQVKTGIQGETYIEILSGLDEGDEVVTGSYRAISRDLSDGSVIRVTAVEEKEG